MGDWNFTAAASRFGGGVRMDAFPCICRCEATAPAGHLVDKRRSGSRSSGGATGGGEASFVG